MSDLAKFQQEYDKCVDSSKSKFPRDIDAQNEYIQKTINPFVKRLDRKFEYMITLRTSGEDQLKSRAKFLIDRQAYKNKREYDAEWYAENSVADREMARELNSKRRAKFPHLTDEEYVLTLNPSPQARETIKRANMKRFKIEFGAISNAVDRMILSYREKRMMQSKSLEPEYIKRDSFELTKQFGADLMDSLSKLMKDYPRLFSESQLNRTTNAAIALRNTLSL